MTPNDHHSFALRRFAVARLVEAKSGKYFFLKAVA